MSVQEYSVERISAKDWPVFKAIRLEAVKNEPGFFGSGYEKEKNYTDEEWEGRLASERRAFFVLKHKDDIVGLTGIVQDSETKKEAILIASYIRAEHRGLGLSKLFYDARLDWAKENDMDSIIVSHRKSNTASKAANQKYGFKQTHSKMTDWPDGTQEEQVYYELDLKPDMHNPLKMQPPKP